jgi:hypothetical protein
MVIDREGETTMADLIKPAPPASVSLHKDCKLDWCEGLHRITYTTELFNGAVNVSITKFNSSYAHLPQHKSNFGKWEIIIGGICYWSRDKNIFFTSIGDAAKTAEIILRKMFEKGLEVLKK